MDDRAVKQRVFRLVGVAASHPICRNFRMSVESNRFALQCSVIGPGNSRSPRNQLVARRNSIATFRAIFAVCLILLEFI